MRINKVTAVFPLLGVAIGGLLAVPPVGALTPAKYYSSCANLAQDYPYGVAKNAKAARHAVREGYYRPSTTKAAKRAYWDSASQLDRDRDGTACES